MRAATKPTSISHPVKASADSLENEFIRVKVDPQTGCMTSLFDKRTNTEALAPAETDSGGPKDRICGNLLQAFVDKPKRWDAWNIDADFENQRTDLMKADEVKLIENGPMRAVLRVKQHFQNSSFIQDITVYAGVPRVDVNMQADWHEKHILLKVAFPLSAHSERATFEIPYGSIQRPTTRNTPAEKAKFEVPALRWADLSDAKTGFSLLNNCKYGYDAKGQRAQAVAAALARMARSPRGRGTSCVHVLALSACGKLARCTDDSAWVRAELRFVGDAGVSS